MSNVHQVAEFGHHARIDHAYSESEPRIRQNQMVDGGSHRNLYGRQAQPDNNQPQQCRQPPANTVPQRTEEIRPDQVADRGGQKGDALLPSARTHVIHHPDRQRRFQHRNAHVRKRDRTGRNDDVRIGDERLQRRRVRFLDHDGRLKHDQLQQPIAQCQRRQDQKRCRFTHKLVHDATERWPDQYTERQSTERDAHRVPPLLVVRVAIGQHAHAGHRRTGRSDTLQCASQEQYRFKIFGKANFFHLPRI
uniref:Uncharacterized protein n=1 Tax=Anopheles coluzzii TaxID=1518534 RepID=A0A8W7PE62_ANOCL